VIGIFVNDDGVALPIPIANIIVIIRGYAEREAAEPEALATSAAETEHMATAKTTRKAAMFPRTIHVIVGIIASRVVADPLVIVVDVRCFRMIGSITEGAILLLIAGFGGSAFWSAIFCGAIFLRTGSVASRRWAMGGNVTPTNIASTAAATLLSATLTGSTGSG
jgi:hypothetical protein